MISYAFCTIFVLDILQTGSVTFEQSVTVDDDVTIGGTANDIDLSDFDARAVRHDVDTTVSLTLPPFLLERINNNIIFFSSAFDLCPYQISFHIKSTV